jgi:hypothetical protein
MNIEQLKRLFSGLPDELMNHFGENNFKTCWYGSSALDNRPMELLDYSHPDTLITNSDKVDVFFYTDIDFFSLNNKLYYHNEIVDFQNSELKYHSRVKTIMKGEILYSGSLQNIDLNGKYLACREVEQLNGWKIYVDGFNQDFFNNVTLDIKSEIEKEKPKFAQDCRELFNEFKNLHTDSEFCKLIGLNNNKEEYVRECVVDKVNKLQERLQTDHTNAKRNYFLMNYPKTYSIVKYKRKNEETFYAFYIDLDDWTFERLLIGSALKINYVVKCLGGAVGPGPRCLGNLQADFAIGKPQPLDETADFDFIPYELNFIRRFFCGELNENNPETSDLYQVQI